MTHILAIGRVSIQTQSLRFCDVLSTNKKQSKHKDKNKTDIKTKNKANIKRQASQVPIKCYISAVVRNYESRSYVTTGQVLSIKGSCFTP